MSEADESQYRLQAVLDTAVDGIITIDERGIIQSANPAVGKLFGFASAAELVGRNVSILMPAGHGQQHDEYIARYMRTGEARVVGIGRELEAVRRDGSIFPIELAVSEVPGDGARYFTGIIRDISARKQAEAGLAREPGADPGRSEHRRGRHPDDQSIVASSRAPTRPPAACSATTRRNSLAETYRC